MKKQFSFLFLVLLSMGALLTACGTGKEVENDAAFDVAKLRAGTWTIDHVDVNTFDANGDLVATQKIPFGEGQEGGICTFSYDDNNLWTQNDNGELFTARYSLDDRIIYTEGGGTWGVRKMSDSELEIVLRADQVQNPCVYTVSGAVYYLTREAR